MLVFIHALFKLYFLQNVPSNQTAIFIARYKNVNEAYMSYDPEIYDNLCLHQNIFSSNASKLMGELLGVVVQCSLRFQGHGLQQFRQNHPY